MNPRMKRFWHMCTRSYFSNGTCLYSLRQVVLKATGIQEKELQQSTPNARSVLVSIDETPFTWGMCMHKWRCLYHQLGLTSKHCVGPEAPETQPPKASVIWVWKKSMPNSEHVCQACCAVFQRTLLFERVWLSTIFFHFGILWRSSEKSDSFSRLIPLKKKSCKFLDSFQTQELHCTPQGSLYLDLFILLWNWAAWQPEVEEISLRPIYFEQNNFHSSTALSPEVKRVGLTHQWRGSKSTQARKWHCVPVLCNPYSFHSAGRTCGSQRDCRCWTFNTRKPSCGMVGPKTLASNLFKAATAYGKKWKQSRICFGELAVKTQPKTTFSVNVGRTHVWLRDSIQPSLPTSLLESHAWVLGTVFLQHKAFRKKPDENFVIESKFMFMLRFSFESDADLTGGTRCANPKTLVVQDGWLWLRKKFQIIRRLQNDTNLHIINVALWSLFSADMSLMLSKWFWLHNRFGCARANFFFRDTFIHGFVWVLRGFPLLDRPLSNRKGVVPFELLLQTKVRQSCSTKHLCMDTWHSRLPFFGVLRKHSLLIFAAWQFSTVWSHCELLSETAKPTKCCFEVREDGLSLSKTNLKTFSTLWKTWSILTQFETSQICVHHSATLQRCSLTTKQQQMCMKHQLQDRRTWDWQLLPFRVTYSFGHIRGGISPFVAVPKWQCRTVVRMERRVNVHLVTDQGTMTMAIEAAHKTNLELHRWWWHFSQRDEVPNSAVRERYLITRLRCSCTRGSHAGRKPGLEGFHKSPSWGDQSCPVFTHRVTFPRKSNSNEEARTVRERAHQECLIVMCVKGKTSSNSIIMFHIFYVSFESSVQ